MQADLDWVGRDLQRLAAESKLARMPTPSEWERIWCAATAWADAFGIVAENAPIDEFVRKHAPGLLHEDATTIQTLTAITVPPPPTACPPTAPQPA